MRELWIPSRLRTSSFQMPVVHRVGPRGGTHAEPQAPYGRSKSAVGAPQGKGRLPECERRVNQNFELRGARAAKRLLAHSAMVSSTSGLVMNPGSDAHAVLTP